MILYYLMFGLGVILCSSSFASLAGVIHYFSQAVELESTLGRGSVALRKSEKMFWICFMGLFLGLILGMALLIPAAIHIPAISN